MNKNGRNFWLDLTMFFAFLITIVSGFVIWTVTGFAGMDRAIWLAVHEGFGAIGLLGVILHVVWHWDWLNALRGRSIRTLKKPVRTNRVVDRITWFAYIASNGFGMLAWLLPASVPGEVIRIFSRLHVATGLVWLAFLAIHLVLHQKWIVAAIRRYSAFTSGMGSDLTHSPYQ
jgi:hypothetical protein